MKGIRLENGKELFYDDVVVATGGMSYQTTGSDGDGYRFAEEAGLAVTPLRPALVPLETEEAYIRELQGLSLKNVTMTIKNGKKTLFDGFGEMLFYTFWNFRPAGAFCELLHRKSTGTAAAERISEPEAGTHGRTAGCADPA